MKKNIKNANMVEIANARIMSIYESIMSEGILGALGGAAIGSALGAGAGALGGDAFKGSNLVQDATKNVNLDIANQKVADHAQAQLGDIETQIKPLQDKVATSTAETAAAKTAYDAALAANTNKPLQYSNSTQVKTTANAYTAAQNKLQASRSELTTAQAGLDAAKAKAKAASDIAANKHASTFDNAIKWSGDNPIAAGAAVGGTVGGAIGAFAHDDRKDEGDDEVFEDDDRLF